MGFLCFGRKSRKAAAKPKTAADEEEKKATRITILKFAVTLFFPIFLETLDYTVVAIAQSDIASYFDRLDLQTYIGTVYTLTASVFLPVYAPFARTFGNHFALQTALFLFILGSALCTGAQNIEMVLAGRGIAGIGAAGLLATARIILLSTLTGNDRGWQLKLVLWLYFPGFICGPLIGGALTTINFRWIFAINLPCCVLSSIFAYFLLRPIIDNTDAPPRNPSHSKSRAFYYKLFQIDWIAAILFVIGGILLLLGLNYGSTKGWTQTVTLVGLIVGFSMLVFCITWEYVLERFQLANKSGKHNARPLRPPFISDALLPLDLFRVYDTVAGFFMTFTAGMILFVVFYFTSIYYTIVLQLSTTQTGLQTLFFVPGLIIGTQISARIVRKREAPKVAACLGGFILTLAVGLVSYAVQDGVRSQLDGFVVLVGVGTGLTTNSLQIYLRQSQPFPRGPVLATLFLFFRSFGGTIGLVQCSTILNAKVTAQIKSMATASNSAALNSINAASIHSVDDINNLPDGTQDIVRAAFGNSIRFCFVSLVPWLGLSFLVMLFATNNRGRFEERLAKMEKKKRLIQEREKRVMEEEEEKRKQMGLQAHIDLEAAMMSDEARSIMGDTVASTMINDSTDDFEKGLYKKKDISYMSERERVEALAAAAKAIKEERARMAAQHRLSGVPTRRTSTPHSAAFAVDYL